MRLQLRDNFHAAKHCGEHDGRHANPVVSINVRAVFQEHPCGFQVAVVARDHEQRVAFVVSEIRQQAGDDLIE